MTNHNLNPEHEKVSRTAFERIKAHIARTVFSAAEILDVLGEEKPNEEKELNERI